MQRLATSSQQQAVSNKQLATSSQQQADNEYEIFIHVDEKTLHTILKIDLTKETEEDGIAGLLNEHLVGQNIQFEYTCHEEENYGVRIKLL